MTRTKQLSLLKEPRKNTKLWWIARQKVYGGSLNYRKIPRPFDSKMLTHTVLKSDLGVNVGFLKFERPVRQILNRAARRYGVQIEELALHTNHIHLLTFTKSREGQIRFLRFLTAELGRFYSRLRKRLGYALRRLWVKRPFTRLVSFGKKSVLAARIYIRRNRFEATGFIDSRPRKYRLDLFLARWEFKMSGFV